MSETAASLDPTTVPGRDIMPLVARSGSGNMGLWVFLAILAVGGLALFGALSANREAAQAPRTSAPATGQGRVVAPPPLALPSIYADAARAPRVVAPAASAARPVGPGPLARTVQSTYRPPAQPRSLPATPPPAPVYAERTPLPPVAYDPPSRPDQRRPSPDQAEQLSEDRIYADRFRNPGRTVPQGTVIPAVLETAVDSTRPGAVRALVQRDVRGFDGSRVLIHRGSRLYGTYEGGVERGQNRALIRWTRLIRPDGVTVALDSPASDPLGRAGVKGKVDGKFLQRFGGALLQSVLDIGVGVASREASDGVIVALPGSTQNVAPRVSQADIQPTLKIRHGTSVSVFVAKDLDFSQVDG